jgi:hypothetical protein
LCVDLHVMGQTACGWAFDAGMREAERNQAVGNGAYLASGMDWCWSRPCEESAQYLQSEAVRLGIWKPQYEKLRHGADCGVERAVAAERERCLYACYRESRFAHPSVDAVRDLIESGDPAPREG